MQFSTRFRSRWRPSFRAYDVKMMRHVWRLSRKITASRTCLFLFNDSLKCSRNYCINGSVCRYKFPTVVLARILGEVGTLCTVLFNVYSGTCLCLPIFIEICSYLTNTEQKKSWHVFYWDRVYISQCILWYECCYLDKNHSSSWYFLKFKKKISKRHFSKKN